MKYLLTFVRDQDQMYEGTEEEMRQAMEAWNEFNRQAIEVRAVMDLSSFSYEGVTSGPVQAKV